MKKSKVSKRFNWLNKDTSIVEKAIKKSLDELSQDVLEVAKNVLRIDSSDPEFTQKHGAILAEYLSVQKDGNTRVIAPIEYASEEILWELYFAEYGAGLGTSHNILGSNSNYINYGKHILINGIDHWFYPTNPIGDEYDLTPTSTALGYMLEARMYAKQNGIRQIKTNIRRVLKGE